MSVIAVCLCNGLNEKKWKKLKEMTAVQKSDLWQLHASQEEDIEWWQSDIKIHIVSEVAYFIS